MRIFILFGFCIAFVFVGSIVSSANSLPYEAIFNFGDSISDTGNAASLYHGPAITNSPYGSTYFKGPSGRLSNGRLIIDFIAEAYGLPFLPPYLSLSKDQDIKKGVNFAFAGATALEYDYFSRNGAERMPPTNNSLSVQLGWFKTMKASLCKSKEECNRYFTRSLFLVGEIGGNDLFSYILYKDIGKHRNLVPSMVEAITNTANVLLEEGVTQVAIPGNFPMGCSASVLTVVNSPRKEDYDEFGCLIPYNIVIEYFNEQLKNAIDTLRKKHPQANIIYFDYYNNAKRFYQSPQQYGFTSNGDEIMKACCGAGGTYNVILGIDCGMDKSTVCSDPSKQINWDGAHLTEAAYRQIAKGLVEGPFSNRSLGTPPLKIA